MNCTVDTLTESLARALAPFVSSIQEAFAFLPGSTFLNDGRPEVELIVIGEARPLDLIRSIDEVKASLGQPIHVSLYASVEWETLKTTDPMTANIDSSHRVWIIEPDFDFVPPKSTFKCTPADLSD